MKFKIRFADQIVGVFSVAALAGLAVLVFAAGSKQHWFEKKINYYTVFDSGSGISVGMDLTYKGFSIGKVSKVSLEGMFVRVDYYVLGEYSSFVKENSLVQLVTSPIGLGSSFSFYPGNGPELLREGSEIYRIDSIPGQRIVDSKLIHVEKQSDSIGALMSQVSDLLGHVNSLVGQLDSALSGNIKDKTTPIQSIVLQIESITKNINEIIGSDDGVVGRALGPELTKNLESTMGNISQISRNLTGVSANADKMIGNAAPQVDNALIQLNSVLLEVQDVLTGLKNNPLLRGGIPDRSKSSSSTAQLRSSEF